MYVGTRCAATPSTSRPNHHGRASSLRYDAAEGCISYPDNARLGRRVGEQQTCGGVEDHPLDSNQVARPVSGTRARRRSGRCAEERAEESYQSAERAGDRQGDIGNQACKRNALEYADYGGGPRRKRHDCISHLEVSPTSTEPRGEDETKQ